MNLLNKNFPSKKYPPILIHLFYLFSSITFCYLYYHKFVANANLYSRTSGGGIYAVLNFEALKPVQYRLLIPFIFKAITFFKLIPDKAAFFLITVAVTYFILLSFYFLLNCYFQSNEQNYWLAFIIIYPMTWNFIILNGQFFYMDFSILLIIILGFYFIVTEKFKSMLIVFFFGVLNHPSVGYLIIAFLLFNYKKLFTKETILYSLAMLLIYFLYYFSMSYIFIGNPGYFVIFNFPRNIGLYYILKPLVIIRDLLLIFGAMHLFLLVFLISGKWRQFRNHLMYINIIIIPFALSVLLFFSIEEIRNYIAIIPFVTILSLIYFSTLENTFLKPVPELLTKRILNKKN